MLRDIGGMYAITVKFEFGFPFSPVENFSAHGLPAALGAHFTRAGFCSDRSLLYLRSHGIVRLNLGFSSVA